MKIAISGPMRGKPNFNHEAFFDAEAQLWADDHEVFNPARQDNTRHGSDMARTNPTGSIAQATAEHDFNLRDALGACTAWICHHADAIYMLDGWRASKGATAEHALALALDLKVMFDDG